jgi:hypothetical protein
MINFQYFPRSQTIPNHLSQLVKVFQKFEKKIESKSDEQQISNAVLAIIKDDLKIGGYRVEVGKTIEDKIAVPVLFGKNGVPEKSFNADAWDMKNKTVLEVEAGRAVTNYQFLKDLFQATMMDDVDYCAIAVRNIYRKSNDFDKVCNFFETMYISRRLVLPLKGILIIGY